MMTQQQIGARLVEALRLAPWSSAEAQTRGCARLAELAVDHAAPGWLSAFARRLARDVLPPVLRGGLTPDSGGDRADADLNAAAARCARDATHEACRDAAVQALRHRGKHSHRANAAMHVSIGLHLASAAEAGGSSASALTSAAAVNLAAGIGDVAASCASGELRDRVLFAAARALVESYLDVGWLP